MDGAPVMKGHSFFINMIIKEKECSFEKKATICSNSIPEAPFWYPFFLSVEIGRA